MDTLLKKFNLSDKDIKKAMDIVTNSNLVGHGAKDKLIDELTSKLPIDKKMANEIYNTAAKQLTGDMAGKVLGMFKK